MLHLALKCLHLLFLEKFYSDDCNLIIFYPRINSMLGQGFNYLSLNVIPLDYFYPKFRNLINS